MNIHAKLFQCEKCHTVYARQPSEEAFPDRCTGIVKNKNWIPLTGAATAFTTCDGKLQPFTIHH